MSEAGEQPTTGLHILVVDDDAVFTETLTRALKRRGHGARACADGETAMSELAESPYDAVVLDLRMSGDSGLRWIAPMKAALPDLRILLLTGYASIATAVEAIKLGATHYLPKPASVEDILAALGRGEGDARVAPPDDPLTVDRLEWEHIQKVLGEHEGNLSATARALKMHRRTLQRKLAKRPARG